MENSCWDFNTRKGKVMLVEQGKNFAKLAGAASAPSAADVCPAVICQRHTDADSDPLLTDTWRGGEGAVWGSTCTLGRWSRNGTVESPVQEQRSRKYHLAPLKHHTAPGWGSMRCEAAAAQRAEEKGGWNRQDLFATPEATQRRWKPPPRPAEGRRVLKEGRQCLVYQRWCQHTLSHGCLGSCSK